jgi:hypothetical protein
MIGKTLHERFLIALGVERIPPDLTCWGMESDSAGGQGQKSPPEKRRKAGKSHPVS